MKHIWSIICQSSVIDNTDNTISLFNVLEEITVGVKSDSNTMNNNLEKIGTINVPIKYEVVSLWVKEPTEKVVDATIELEILDPDSKKLYSLENKIEVKEIHRRLRSRMQVQGFNVTKSGIYVINIKLKESGKENFTTVAKVPLEVRLVNESMP